MKSKRSATADLLQEDEPDGVVQEAGVVTGRVPAPVEEEAQRVVLNHVEAAPNSSPFSSAADALLR